MKIIWINDFTLKENKGGSQQTQAELIRFGLNKYSDLSILTMTPRTIDENKFKYCDLVILNNIQGFEPEFINKIINNYRYIKMEADYDVVNNIDKYPLIYKNSQINLFRSPLLLKIIAGEIEDLNKVDYIPSCINTDIFYNYKQQRIKNSCYWAGNAVPEKGLKNVIKYIDNNPHLKLYASILETTPDSEDLREFKKRAILMPTTENEQMPELYNMFENFIHLPEWGEPTGRAYMEAYLCGCNVIGNDKIGWNSYSWDFNDHNNILFHLKYTPYKFWGIVFAI